MRTAEEQSGTVLHRLIQEQLRYGNLTDNRTLLAIQQQALRGGTGGGTGSPQNSVDNVVQEEGQLFQDSKRQEPQGQEYQGDHYNYEDMLSQCRHLPHKGEELPTYEEAKMHSQYFSSHKVQQPVQVPTNETDIKKNPQVCQATNHLDEGLRELKHGHVRSLSERILQMTLERNGAKSQNPISSSHSFPQLQRHCYPNRVPSDCQRPTSQASSPKGPPPEYPNIVRSPGGMLSHSQEQGYYCSGATPPFCYPASRMAEASFPYQQQQYGHVTPFINRHEGFMAAQNVSTGSQMDHMERLLKENEVIRKDLENYIEKATRIEKMEAEIQRISEAYENLMKASTKRESLEKAMRNKMEGEMRRLQDFNRDLKDRLETATRQLTRKELEAASDCSGSVGKLMAQNKEHLQEKEKLEREVSIFNSANEELRRQVELLEQTLSTAQAKIAKMESELRKKRAYVEKVERLQHALTQLQAACEKREQLELKLRNRLEQELKILRGQQRQTLSSSCNSSEHSAPVLMEVLREKEERILALEADMTKWEQKYLEESTMRQFAMDAAATAAAQRDTTIINHSPRHSPSSSFNEDLEIANYRHQEMENRIKALHALLLEKDAVIKVMQQRTKKEQGKVETAALRPAKSVPSLFAAPGLQCWQAPFSSSSSQLTSERLADKAPRGSVGTLMTRSVTEEQRGTGVPVASHSKHRSKDGSTQTDGTTADDELMDANLSWDKTGSENKDETMAQLLSPEFLQWPSLSCSKTLDSSSKEMVEILI
ncbi:angiomotin-like protein 2 [Protopterus annectens]|uniref:angiomotin-like protein 2 n=1 Tax=Protopterus annectens TaxID=7888 RepID=UPI001CFB6FAC|nr:angiomotin-like protein 2 [Protopterus annectens]